MPSNFSNECRVCKIIRSYLYFAVPLLAFLAAGGSNMQDVGLWFSSVRLIDVLAYGSLLALALIIVFRIFQEIYLPRKRLRQLQELSRKGSSTYVNDHTQTD